MENLKVHSTNKEAYHLLSVAWNMKINIMTTVRKGLYMHKHSTLFPAQTKNLPAMPNFKGYFNKIYWGKLQSSVIIFLNFKFGGFKLVFCVKMTKFD